IHGHTDNVGGDAFNKDLSERRAAAVKEYLISKGIASERMSNQGFGMSRPVAANDTEEGRARNRRTEFVIVKK
ncbi:MAG: OmpA family protein, partial [Bacteroidales bacterium]|nr:OmpA family protein [Bacteroidales bacterium]